MTVKDKIVQWFIKNILNPNIEIINKPGFIITSFSEKRKETYLRDMFLEEDLFIEIENKIVDKFGKNGKQILYSAGKKFGYLYAGLSNFLKFEGNKKEFENFCYLLTRYVTSIYASSAEHKLDVENKKFEIFLKDYIVCRNNGLGYIMADGGIAGIWSNIIGDKTVEGLQLSCQGRKNDICHVLCEPENALKEKHLDFFKEVNLSEEKFTSNYKKLNQIRPTKFAKNSLKTLLDRKFFFYKEGNLSFKSLRYFNCESNILYILEEEIRNLSKGDEVLFNACVVFGKKLFKISKPKDFRSFITDYFSSLGWGDVFLKVSGNKYKILVNYFPWTTYSKNSKFVIFRGILSGFVSEALNKKVVFNKFKSEIRNSLSVVISG